MASVTNLTIKLQTGSSNIYYATWEFNETTNVTASGVKTGNFVSIKAGATYYNGVAIPSWIMGQQWKVVELIGDRAVLGPNTTGTNNIMSPINVKYLNGGTAIASQKNTLDHYTVKWYYDTGNGVWFTGGSSDVKLKNATYSAPSNTLRIRVTVTPVSKTYTVNGNDTSYWTGTAVSKTYELSYDPPDKPSVPSVNIEKYELTTTLTNISDARTDEIQFEIYNGTKAVKTGTVTVLTRQATFSCYVTAGGKYRVRCRAINICSTSRIYGEWSDYSREITTIPLSVSDVRASADSETSVKVSWTAESTATSYTVEYTDNKLYFDSSSKVSSMSVTNSIAYVTGLETGKEWFFRVKSVNDKGDSDWSSIVSTTIGTKTAAPTTWSSTTTAITGEPLTLYWIHNSEDGSTETYAQLELIINGTSSTETIKNTKTDEENTISTYSINTSSYVEGTKIQWRVKTAGITETYGDWSAQRTVDIYAPPTLELSMTDTDGTSIENLTSFPFYITALAGPKTQAPIGFHITITSNNTYETVDYVGNTKIVSQGEEIYSKYFDITGQLSVEFTPGNLDLENNTSYAITCEASMNSGLTATSSLTFDVNWTEDKYEPNAEISFDPDTLVAYIRPYCSDENDELIENVLLSVYRREFDGTFTELAINIDNFKNTFITDPHPALDYARYRIVAITQTTGAVSYYDPPGYPIGEKAVIIQWDEEWTSFDTTNEDKLEESTWSGSFLKLPYNIDVSDSNSIDVSLIEYIGRSHPVSYYGTQLGSSSSWSVEIPKNDKETLYALRRLAIWMGDVYVREPSGSGYWASISVSFSQKHRNLTIPVTLNITRVEGGA